MKIITPTLLIAALFCLSCSSSGIFKVRENSNNNSSRSSPSPPVEAMAAIPDVIKPVDGMIALQPSDILEMMENYRKQLWKSNRIDPASVAEYGNSLLAAKGYNYQIDVSELIKEKVKNNEATIVSDKNYSFPLEMTLTNGQKQTFIIMAPREDSCCCGYHYAHLPVTKIAEKEITFVADGKQFTVRRPKEFGKNEVFSLVQPDDLKKVILKWQIPYEGYPDGVSEDGKKLYKLAGDDFYKLEIDDVYQEISPDGTFRFTTLAPPGERGQATNIDLGPDPDNAYQGCWRFSAGGKDYFVRFSSPCT
jgi:hypothetical protein